MGTSDRGEHDKGKGVQGGNWEDEPQGRRTRGDPTGPALFWF